LIFKAFTATISIFHGKAYTVKTVKPNAA